MENNILNLFAYESALTFSEIKNRLKVRSNHLSYWISILLKRGIIQKKDGEYSLSESSEYLVPYLSESKGILPVVVVQIGDERKCFLCKRAKRPYKGLLSLPAGRILIGESIEDAAKRIMKTKFAIKIFDVKLKSISLEHIKKRGKTIYSFILILTQAKTSDKIELTDVKVKKKIIPSDMILIKSEAENDVKIKTIYSKYQ